MALNYNNSCAHRRQISDSRPQSGDVDINNQHGLFLSHALFKIGDTVAHNKFGVGSVVSNCFSPTQPVDVDFDGAKKTIMPSFITAVQHFAQSLSASDQ